jgi:PAS domain S-box-containing protein
MPSVGRHVTTGAKVLYVGRPEDREGPCRYLERSGFEVREVDSADEAVAALPWPDCLVAAHDLPDGDGVDLLRRVRRSAPDLPFVLYTDAGDETVASEAVAAGVTAYLPADALTDSLDRLTERVRSATSGDSTASNPPDPGDRLGRLESATRDLMDETEPERIAERTAAAADAILDVEEATVHLRDGDGLSAAATSHGADGTERGPVADSTASEAATDGRYVVEDGEASVPLGDHGVITVRAPDGEPLGDDDLRVAAVLATNAEAALERAANETALRRERDELAALFENIPDPTIGATVENGEAKVDRLNTAFEETFGYDEQELLGENVDEYIVPEHSVEEATQYNQRIESGERIYGEVERRTTDGLREFILHVVAHDVGETETRGYAIYTNITDQKQRQRELERQNQRIELLHDVAGRMKAAPDRETVYDIVIDAAEDILDFDFSILDEIEGDQLVLKAISSGLSLADYYEETPIDKEDNLGAETARTGETFVVSDLRQTRYAPANFEYRSALSVPLGEWGIFQAVATEEDAFSEADRQLAELLADHADGAIDRLARERELEERAEELARQNERLDQFASVVSHDLKNPLSVARGRLEMARSTGDPDHFGAVERAHERIEELVNGLLTLSRRGDLRGEPVPVDLDNAARQAWRTVETGELELVVDADRTVKADPERLRQLLENLFTNAVEHADGATAVTIREVEDGFAVADDGHGIPSGDREAILESGHTGSETGTGLGLAIVDTIVDAHGWTVSIGESDAGGARFEFRTAAVE